ncbi:MAG: substrate-binding domain-containing protein [Aliarcobacter sp.]|nr:substrate-binding domain-containing protein [Aliarcobacter sp.]
MSLPGIDVLGPLPPAVQIVTVFSAGLSTTSTQPTAVRALLAFLTSAATTATKQRNGMDAA